MSNFIHRLFCKLWNRPYWPDVYEYSLLGLVGEVIERIYKKLGMS